MSRNTFHKKLTRRLVSIFCSILQYPRIIKYRLLSNVTTQGKPCLYQPMQTIGSGKIKFAFTCKIGVFPSPYFFSTYAYFEARNLDAEITIDEETWINNGFCAIAEHTKITIGKRVRIGTNVEIFDSDFHGLKISDRDKSEVVCAKPVIIEDDVFLGSNVRVLKGVTLGKGCVIANGSVVTRNIAAGMIAAGSSEKEIRKIPE